MTTDPKELISLRRGQHGNWLDQAALAQRLKGLIAPHARDMAPQQREALDMILVKVSRICSGDPNHEDHWNDIAGYALLGRGGHSG